jgi:ADP-dependent NAD(P)H-hydrate dehydratase / NAD(P)H-hydrate epimerase
MENAPALWEHDLRWPSPTAHKHQRGSLAVVSGPLSKTGAARLAAQAGLRSGAGLVTLFCPPGALIAAASSLTAVMTESFADADALVAATARANAVVIGPAAGTGDATRANVEALAAAGRRLVLDADALTVFAADAPALRRCLGSEAVLTPHPGEFERLFPGLLDAPGTRIDAARAAAAISGAVVLLKGPDTIIAAPDGRAVVNTHATPFLATAGSGDVLAGLIGGLMAQGLGAFVAACAAAWMHGDAGLRAGPGLTSEDLDASLRQTIAALYAARHRVVT